MNLFGLVFCPDLFGSVLFGSGSFRPKNFWTQLNTCELFCSNIFGLVSVWIFGSMQKFSSGNTTKNHKFNDSGFPREFVVKESLRGISEETGFVVIRSS